MTYERTPGQKTGREVREKGEEHRGKEKDHPGGGEGRERKESPRSRPPPRPPSTGAPRQPDTGQSGPPPDPHTKNRPPRELPGPQDKTPSSLPKRPSPVSPKTLSSLQYTSPPKGAVCGGEGEVTATHSDGKNGRVTIQTDSWRASATKADWAEARKLPLLLKYRPTRQNY